jgi:diaminopimelate epimerase
MGRPFAKYEGLGNDFVVLGAADERELSSELGAFAARLCDRRRGIGADGVLLILPPRDTACDARMKVVNADGSVPEMCGNGLRCVALHVARARRMQHGELLFDTDAGPRACTIDDTDGRGMVTVDMGIVRAAGKRELDVGGERVEAWLADAGNPHAIVFGEASRARAEAIGPTIERHPSFPRGTNVEAARVDAAAAAIELVVWERGVGITLACGTGACATVAVACARGLLPYGRRTTVNLPGGALEITIAEDGRCTMRGPARHVFAGQLPA